MLIKIGSICYAVARSLKEKNRKQCNGKDDEEEKRVLSDVTSMLELARKNCSPNIGKTKPRLGTGRHVGYKSAQADSSALGIFFDELCLAVKGQTLLPEIKNWILDRFSGDLEEKFLGDFDEVATHNSESKRIHMIDLIVDEGDKRIASGTLANSCFPTGEMRFNIDGEMALVYVKLLSMVNPSGHTCPQQLCPLLRLLVTCHDVRYGGAGLAEIDAVLGCPLFLPNEDSCTINFESLTDLQKWTTAASLFYAVCWSRELINCFVHSAVCSSSILQCSVTSQTATQVQEEVRGKLVEKLISLVTLEEELDHVSSKCHDFKPPGSQPIEISQELLEMKPELYDSGNNGDKTTTLDSTLEEKMTKEEKKALADIKKATAKRTSARAKSKQKYLKLRSKFELSLTRRCKDALRPLSSNVCLALGFPQLRLGNQGTKNIESSQEIMMSLSLGASQLRHFHVGGPLPLLLLNHLCDGLANAFVKDKATRAPFKKDIKISILVQPFEDDFRENPYLVQNESLMNSNKHDDDSFSFLDNFISGEVFVSVHEHLATVAEISGGPTLENEEQCVRNLDDNNECICLLFRCISIIVSAKELSILPNGRIYLEAIMKQLSDGDSIDLIAFRKTASTNSLLRSILNLYDLVEEIVSGESSNIDLITDGVKCLDSTLSLAINLLPENRKYLCNSNSNKEFSDVLALPKRVSDLCHRLLKRRWHTDNKYNKNNVGKLVELFLEHSSILGNSYDNMVKLDVTNFGRVGAISTIVEDILAELAITDGCRGPVEAYPTCCYTSFGFFFSSTLTFLPKELCLLFESSATSSSGSIIKVLDRLVIFLKILFDLTKDYDSLAKRPVLLNQLRTGTLFMEKFIQKAIPFLETHFEAHQHQILSCISNVQRITRQLNVISSHGKRVKDPLLSKEAPRVKKVCEVFIHKMKALMKKNGVLGAFGGGNLKSKHIDGSLVESDNSMSSDHEKYESYSEAELDD